MNRSYAEPMNDERSRILRAVFSGMAVGFVLGVLIASNRRTGAKAGKHWRNLDGVAEASHGLKETILGVGHSVKQVRSDISDIIHFFSLEGKDLGGRLKDVLLEDKRH